MRRTKSLIDIRKLGEAKNLKLKELIEEISEASRVDSRTKPTWGRRFNASGKNKSGAPKIRLSYTIEQ